MEKRSEVKKQPVGYSKQGEFIRCMEEKARPAFFALPVYESYDAVYMGLA